MLGLVIHDSKTEEIGRAYHNLYNMIPTFCLHSLISLCAKSHPPLIDTVLIIHKLPMFLMIRVLKGDNTSRQRNYSENAIVSILRTGKALASTAQPAAQPYLWHW